MIVDGDDFDRNRVINRSGYSGGSVKIKWGARGEGVVI